MEGGNMMTERGQGGSEFEDKGGDLEPRYMGGL